MQRTNSNSKDFSTISPSAKWLLLLKGYTNIPFARETAEMIIHPKPYVPDFSKKDLMFWARTLHFEMRYWSIDQLLEDLELKNVLELSSGYSFKGLEKSIHENIYYIDTDLPEVIEAKTKMVESLKKDLQQKEKYELMPLNVFDKKQFKEVTDHFPEGEIVIVNEGLLMYLNREEKKNLCKTVHDILEKRNGYWIVADIYVKREFLEKYQNKDGRLKEYYDQHNIEENKFESFEDAEKFFNNAGFVIDKVAKINPRKLSSWKYLRKCLTLKHFFLLSKRPKIQATWRLRISD